MASPVGQASFRQVYELMGVILAQSNHSLTSMIAAIYEDKPTLIE